MPKSPEIEDLITVNVRNIFETVDLLPLQHDAMCAATTAANWKVLLELATALEATAKALQYAAATMQTVQDEAPDQEASDDR